MSGDLILWRHAEAAPREAGEVDERRGLTAKGHRQARKMAEWLDPRLPSDCRVLCSPAVRAVQTAEALNRKCTLVADLAPDTDVARILSAARWPDAHDSVLVIGHQPALGRIAAYLLSGSKQDWTVRKASVWWIGRRSLSDTHDVPPDGAFQYEAYLRAVMAPEMI